MNAIARAIKREDGETVIMTGSSLRNREARGGRAGVTDCSCLAQRKLEREIPFRNQPHMCLIRF